MADRFLQLPLHVDGRGRTATVVEEEHIRELVYQVLFTNPGERVNRPDFGCGLLTLVFEPNSEVLAAATELLVKAALQRWLENEIQVEGVDVRSIDSTLAVVVRYHVRSTGASRVDTFRAPG
jgi:phage baseplate assembly protein W